MSTSGNSRVPSHPSALSCGTGADDRASASEAGSTSKERTDAPQRDISVFANDVLRELALRETMYR